MRGLSGYLATKHICKTEEMDLERVKASKGLILEKDNRLKIKKNDEIFKMVNNDLKEFLSITAPDDIKMLPPSDKYLHKFMLLKKKFDSKEKKRIFDTIHEQEVKKFYFYLKKWNDEPWLIDKLKKNKLEHELRVEKRKTDIILLKFDKRNLPVLDSYEKPLYGKLEYFNVVNKKNSISKTVNINGHLMSCGYHRCSSAYKDFLDVDNVCIPCFAPIHCKECPHCPKKKIIILCYIVNTY